MNAEMRAVLQWLVERRSRAYAMSAIADWLELPRPKVQGALAKLREHGLVSYFTGDPGTWTSTGLGREEIHGSPSGSAERYRMALEAILASQYLSEAGRIAKVALK